MKAAPNVENLLAFKTSIKAYDFLMCIDLEATCDELKESEHPRALIVSPEEMETIEIGVVVIDLHKREAVDIFRRYVRPLLHPTLTEFCIKLTSIKQADVDAAQPFSIVSTEFNSFLKKYPNAIWGSWGNYDANQLATDALRAGCVPMLPNVRHLNMEWHYREIFACPSIGLREAVERLGLHWAGQYHRAVDDAKNLADMVLLLLAMPDKTCS